MFLKFKVTCTSSKKANNINLYNKELFLGADFYVVVYWGMNRARMLLMKSVIY